MYLSGLLNPDPLVSPSNISNELRDVGEEQGGKGKREGIKRVKGRVLLRNRRQLWWGHVRAGEKLGWQAVNSSPQTAVTMEGAEQADGAAVVAASPEHREHVRP